MIFFLRYQDKEYRVRVESREKKLHVSFDHEPEESIDLFFFGNDCTFIDQNNVFNANIVGNKSHYTVWRPQGSLNFQVESEYRRIVGILRGQSLEASNNIYAKMPGKMAKIFVKPGDTVTVGQAVAVMEAMKMENEIRSTIEGEVTGVGVKEGQAVETGTLLIEIKPPEQE